MTPSFNQRVMEWSNPPVDDIGYISSKVLLAYTSDRLSDLIRKTEVVRYGGWRNHRNNWRTCFELDETSDKYVLDYGCGIGIEALQYARSGNEVAVCDISKDNVRLAMRILKIEGYDCAAFVLEEDPVILAGPYDVIHCAGVLHHIPEPIPVVEKMAAALKDNGELRLMVYSDEAWRIACRTEPPENVQDDERFERFWKRWDAVGGYADWYNYQRLDERFGAWFGIKKCQALTAKGEYLGAVLVKR